MLVHPAADPGAQRRSSGARDYPPEITDGSSKPPSRTSPGRRDDDGVRRCAARHTTIVAPDFGVGQQCRLDFGDRHHGVDERRRLGRTVDDDDRVDRGRGPRRDRGRPCRDPVRKPDGDDRECAQPTARRFGDLRLLGPRRRRRCVKRDSRPSICSSWRSLGTWRFTSVRAMANPPITNAEERTDSGSLAVTTTASRSTETSIPSITPATSGARPAGASSRSCRRSPRSRRPRRGAIRPAPPQARRLPPAGRPPAGAADRTPPRPD